MGFLDRLVHAWNAFLNDKSTYNVAYADLGGGSSYRPDKMYFSKGNERSIINAIYNRIAIDVTNVSFEHAKLDLTGRYKKVIDSGLNRCLTLEANIDQTNKSFIQDIVQSMFDEGVVAVVPVDTDIDPNRETFDILSMRVCKITQWFPKHVEVEIYNEKTGLKQLLIVPKERTAIIENPFYSVMNERNSTLQRLVRKLNILDAIEEQAGSGKLDLIIQLPYVVKSEARKEQAQKRRADIEEQLNGSKFGIAYTDGTEKITQLNRPINNNMMDTVEYLTRMLFNQLSVTSEILNGTADEKTIQQFMQRTIKPIAEAIANEMTRKFISRDLQNKPNGETVYFNVSIAMFKLVPPSTMADVADKFTRNEILSSNEVRQLMGFPPVDNPKADELRNKNLNASENPDVASTTDKFSLNGNEGDTNQNA